MAVGGNSATTYSILVKGNGATDVSGQPVTTFVDILAGAPDANITNSAAVSYVSLNRTCGRYNPDGSPFSDCRFANYTYNSAAATNNSPSQDACCVSVSLACPCTLQLCVMQSNLCCSKDKHSNGRYAVLKSQHLVHIHIMLSSLGAEIYATLMQRVVGPCIDFPSPAVMQVEVFPDVVVTQALTPADGQLLIGDTVTATFDLTNQGSGTGLDVYVAQKLSPGMQFVAVPNGENCVHICLDNKANICIDCHLSVHEQVVCKP